MDFTNLIIKNLGILSIEGEIMTDVTPLSLSPALPEDNSYDNHEMYKDEYYIEDINSPDCVEPFSPYGPTPHEPTPPVYYIYIYMYMNVYICI
jgi:hypothetical protein